MENTTVSKRTVAFGLAVAIACVVNAVIVVVKEKSDYVMAEMKKLTGHHWITHSLIVILLFLGLGWVFSLLKGGKGIDMPANRLIGTLVSGVAVAGAIIVGFYLFVD